MTVVQVYLHSRAKGRVMLMFQIGTVGIIGLCFGAFQVYRLYWPKEDTDLELPKEPKAQPSQQVLQLMMMMGSSIPLIVSGFFVRLFHIITTT
jgi:hypothetical protein